MLWFICVFFCQGIYWWCFLLGFFSWNSLRFQDLIFYLSQALEVLQQPPPCRHLLNLRFGLAGFARFGPDVPGNALTAYDLDTKATGKRGNSSDDGPLMGFHPPEKDNLTCFLIPQEKECRHVFKARDIYVYLYIYIYIRGCMAEYAACSQSGNRWYRLHDSRLMPVAIICKIECETSHDWRNLKGVSYILNWKGKLCQIIRSFSCKMEIGRWSHCYLQGFYIPVGSDFFHQQCQIIFPLNHDFSWPLDFLKPARSF